MGFRPDIDNYYLIVGAPLYGGTIILFIKKFLCGCNGTICI